MTLEQVYYLCPNCRTWLSHIQVMSFYIHNSRLWSDTKTEMQLPECYEFTRCKNCNTLFWWQDACEISQWQIDDLERGHTEYNADCFSQCSKGELDFLIQNHHKIEDGGLNYYFDHPLDLAEVVQHQLADLEQLIATTTDIKREYYLRILFWHAINDLVRYNTKTTSLKNLFRRINKSFLKDEKIQKTLYQRLSPQKNQNLRRLLQLLDTSKLESSEIETSLLRVEILRQLEEFEQALSLLNSLPTTLAPNLHKIVSLQTKKCKSKKSMVYEF